MIFYVNLGDNFRRKTICVSNGNLVETPSFITYNTIVSRDLIRILLMTAAFNYLEITSSDIQNDFLSAPNLEKHWIRAVP